MEDKRVTNKASERARGWMEARTKAGDWFDPSIIGSNSGYCHSYESAFEAGYQQGREDLLEEARAIEFARTLNREIIHRRLTEKNCYADMCLLITHVMDLEKLVKGE